MYTVLQKKNATISIQYDTRRYRETETEAETVMSPPESDTN